MTTFLQRGVDRHLLQQSIRGRTDGRVGRQETLLGPEMTAILGGRELQAATTVRQPPDLVQTGGRLCRRTVSRTSASDCCRPSVLWSAVEVLVLACLESSPSSSLLPWCARELLAATTVRQPPVAAARPSRRRPRPTVLVVVIVFPAEVPPLGYPTMDVVAGCTASGSWLGRQSRERLHLAVRRQAALGTRPNKASLPLEAARERGNSTKDLAISMDSCLGTRSFSWRVCIVIRPEELLSLEAKTNTELAMELCLSGLYDIFQVFFVRMSLY